VRVHVAIPFFDMLSASREKAREKSNHNHMSRDLVDREHMTIRQIPVYLIPESDVRAFMLECNVM